MSRVKDLWEEGARFYHEMHLDDITYHASQAVIVDLLPKNKAISVLDLGAGIGHTAEKILTNIPRSTITCLDLSSGMIEQCRGRLARFGDRVTLVCDNVMSWTPPTRYDVIVSCNALIYREIDLRHCYQKYAAVLHPQGLWINSTVISQHDPFRLEAFAVDLSVPGAPVPSDEAVQFAKVKARALGHFGEGSLIFAETIEHHIEFLSSASLRACCPWHYLTQAVVLGKKEGTESLPNKPAGGDA